jgi:hypothetical protein
MINVRVGGFGGFDDMNFGKLFGYRGGQGMPVRN